MPYLYQALLPTATTIDQVLILAGVATFAYLLWQTFKAKKIGKEFYLGLPALVQVIALAAIASLRIPIDQWGLFGQVLYWGVHVAAITYLIPFLVTTVLYSAYYGISKATGEAV